MQQHQDDVEIIALRKQYRRLTQSYELDEPIWIGDTLYQFHKESLFDGKLQIYLPEQFTELPDEAAKEKYPSINRPQIIMTNEDRTVDFTFSRISETMLPLTTQEVWGELERMFPRNVLYETGEVSAEDLKILWLEYKSFSHELEVYNILFPIMSESVGTIIGAFSCPLTTYEEWKPCVIQIIKAIQIQEESNERV